jgi:hypothetical protein
MENLAVEIGENTKKAVLGMDLLIVLTQTGRACSVGLFRNIAK